MHSSQFYRDLFDESPFGLCVVAADGCVVDCNEAFLGMVGAGRERIVGADLLARQDDRALVPQLAAAIAGERRDFEACYRSLSGRRRRTYRFVLQPLARCGEGLAVLACVEEVGVPRAAEAALRRAAAGLERRVRERTAALATAEAHLRGLVEQSLAGFYVIQEGRIVFANTMFAQQHGYPLDEIIGKPALDLVLPEDRPLVAANLRRRLAGEIDELRYGFRAVHKSGEVIDVEVHGRRADIDGKPSIVGVLLDVTGRRKLERELERQAFYDELTGLPNRKLFYDRLEYMAALSKRNVRSFAVLFIDLDGFKAVNDRLGHRAGDDVLADVGAAMQGCVRESDTLARLGGDEFAVILADLGTVGDAGRVAECLLACTARTRLRDGTPAGITASIGIAVYPEDSDNAEQLMALADDAMYAVKNRGKAGFGRVGGVRPPPFSPGSATPPPAAA